MEWAPTTDLPAGPLACPSHPGLRRLTLGFIFQEAVDFGDGSVEGNNGEAVISCVEDQVLAHDRKANETEITTGFGLRRTDLEAGQPRTKVSIMFVNRDILLKK